jgi:hypothetical protein
MRETAGILFILFTLIASIDAFYFHFYRFRLHARPECRREHLLHTLNACLLPFAAGPLLIGEASGAWLWLALIANLATFGIESLDVLGEAESRKNLGGLPPAEYWMHFTMSGLRWAWVSLAVASIPVERWNQASNWTIPMVSEFQFTQLPSTMPESLGLLILIILFGSLPIAALHLVNVRRA